MRSGTDHGDDWALEQCAMKMIDGEQADDKIIAIHEDDPAYQCFGHINQLPPHLLKMLKRFFEVLK